MRSSIRSITLALLLASTTATADSFSDAFQSGVTLFDARDYAKSRAEFLKAYELRPEPLVLYNIAQTYRLEGNALDAIEYYKRFLAESSIAAHLRRNAEDYVAGLEAKVRAADQATHQVPTPPPPTTTVEPPPLSRTELVRHRHIPLASKIAAGVAGGSLVGAIVLTKLGLSAESALDTSSTRADADRVERYQDLINISWGVTGVAAVAAIAIYIVAPSYVTESKTVVVAPAREGGWTASFAGRF